MKTWSVFVRFALMAKALVADGVIDQAVAARINMVIEEGKARYRQRIAAGRADEPLLFDREVSDLAMLVTKP